VNLLRRGRNSEGSGGNRPSDHINVLAVHTATQPPLGADTWVHARILETLDRATHTLHVACVPTRNGESTPTYDELSTIDGLTFLPVNLGPERDYVYGWKAKARIIAETLPALPSIVRIARYIRTHDITILHTSDRPRDALVCVVLSRLTRAKSIVHIHVLHNDWMGRILRWSIANADARVAVSEFVRTTLESADPGLADSYTVLNAIDIDRWSGCDEETAATTRSGLGVAADVPLVLTVCRLFEEKGVRRLIHALATVREHHPDVHLCIAGTDPSGDHRHLTVLVETVSELGLEQNVSFLGRRSDVAELMGAADIFAMPSFHEPFGLVFAEAMASRLPIVALDNGGTLEVVVHGRHGLLSDTDDAAALAANLGHLLDHPDQRRTMGEAGRSHVEQNFSLERQAADMARVYRLIASKSSTATD
jgi:glycosyltransferase involved in cell wall biosynthesis